MKSKICSYVFFVIIATTWLFFQRLREPEAFRDAHVRKRIPLPRTEAWENYLHLHALFLHPRCFALDLVILVEKNLRKNMRQRWRQKWRKARRNPVVVIRPRDKGRIKRKEKILFFFDFFLWFSSPIFSLSSHSSSSLSSSNFCRNEARYFFNHFRLSRHLSTIDSHLWSKTGSTIPSSVWSSRY